MLATTDPNRMWFMNNEVTVQLAQADNADRLSVLKMRMPCGEGPPLHIHHREDEVFHLLEGEMKFEIDGAVRYARAGETLVAPRGSRHAFRVVSPDGASVLTITRGGFEEMVRAVSRPAADDGLPEAAPPSPAVQHQLTLECAARDIEIVGPPIA